VKIRFDLEGRFQARLEGIAADFDQPELDKMRVVELGVQQHVAPIDQARGEMDQRDL
jgi:hypothetical protein